MDYHASLISVHILGFSNFFFCKIFIINILHVILSIKIQGMTGNTIRYYSKNYCFDFGDIYYRIKDIFNFSVLVHDINKNKETASATMEVNFMYES